MHQGTVNCPHGAFFLQVFLLYNPVKGDAER